MQNPSPPAPLPEYGARGARSKDVGKDVGISPGCDGNIASRELTTGAIAQRLNLPTMSDGGPNGYSIISFDGTKYDLEFRAARRPADHQMNIYLPQEITVADAMTTTMVVNVFNGSQRSKVRMRILPDGPWKDMERVEGMDPYYVDMKKLEAGPTPVAGITLPSPSMTDHLWRILLPPTLPVGTHMSEVETTDRDNKVYTDCESFRVVAIPAPTSTRPAFPGRSTPLTIPLRRP